MRWKEVHVGDVLKVEADDAIPADLLLLQCADAKGVCYVETKNLDGETNLKVKAAEKDLQAVFKDEKELGHLAGHVRCEKPNNAIYKFEGTIQIPQRRKMISLNVDNLLLRGSRLRNTDYVLGVAIYQGHDTKIMQNSA